MMDTMGFLGSLTGGLIGGEQETPTTDETQTPTTDETTTITDNAESLENKQKKKEREEYLEKTSADREGFILHQGDIIETHTYDTIYSTSWNSDYEGMSSDGSITIPFHKEDLEYIYKGVRCLLKTKRFNNFDETIEIDDSEGYLCFITDVSISDGKLELSLSGFEKLLEQENILSFNGQRRSVILAEVIRMAGLEPVIDTTGLADEIINWSTEKSKDDDGGGSDSGGSIEQSDELNDTMDTYQLSADLRTTSAMSEGYIPEDMDSRTKYLKAIGKQGTNYAEYVKGCTTICDMIKKLRAKWKYGGYANSKWKDAEDCFNHINAVNCADSAKLVKCCCDVLGFTCAILHNKQGSAGHYFNVVKKDGKWYTVDLCFYSHCGEAGSTNTLGC